jgi:hypothetical protein
MKKFALMLEAIWVTATFAEAGIYEPEIQIDPQPVLHDAAHTA